ncbi:hypothetical protein, conserved [Eimeria acervulina]|uniref:Uncharacterized protein n=1 Tax=Eimeria acervulina TaxID=5801 RepID=U6GKF2_EIMAC|nr:hypothetical protein, conserved [Eimeria acervulina]CDI80645.1 hypothetical protein, conserved [Eimeria acervulina]
MIKLKKKNREKQHPKAARGAHTPEDAETGKRHRLQVDSASVSQDMGIKKKAKTSSSSFPSACSKEASKTASTAGTATENISLNGGVVDCERLRRAIGALCRHVQKKQKEEEIQDLLANSGGPMVSLMFSLQNVPEGQRIYPHLIPHDASGEVCLIVKDPQRKWKDIVAAAQPSLSFIKKVISYKKLSKKFPQFADKRSLCSAYDLFLVDSKVKEKAALAYTCGALNNRKRSKESA